MFSLKSWLQKTLPPSKNDIAWRHDQLVSLLTGEPNRQDLTFKNDGLWTIHNADFLSDSDFGRAYDRAVKAEGVDHSIQWRLHILFWAAKTAIRLSGDFVECGVNKAHCSTAIMTYLNWNKSHGSRKYYLMDTFCGLVDSLVSEEEKALGRVEMFKDYYSECYEIAKKNVEEFNDVVFIRGPIPDTLQENPSQQIAFMHIDMNCAAPEVAAVRYFWPKIQTGGVVVLDDYAYHGYRPQKEAMDALGKELGFTVASLPTGQGLIIK